MNAHPTFNEDIRPKTEAAAGDDGVVVRLKLAIHGAVQGVGFRPFIYRLANEMKLAGRINNSSQGVLIEIEGKKRKLRSFLARLESDKPSRSFIQSMESTWLDIAGYRGFEIRNSENSGRKTAFVLPDIATCPDCLREMSDPKDRRYLYPFTNCTNCGPRFSIIDSLPYDRANTSMSKFPMCPACEREYNDPNDRRFHAQPNACPVCGPHLELWDAQGERIFANHQALLAAARAIRRGKIVAVKGIGGFHLLADARNEKAVRLLRERKQREEKPFALMFSSFENTKTVCEISLLEERLLRSPEAPIVLLHRRRKFLNSVSLIAKNVAPGNPYFGVMLPANPLHHLLMAELGFPVIATSGNLSDEPLCIGEEEALERLGAIADAFLVHDRPIVRHVDDSIARVMLDREMVLRRARGFAPLPMTLHSGHEIPDSETVLAVGAHLKNSVALSIGNQVFISQHIGDLETEPANNAFRRVAADFEKIYEASPQIVAADLHLDYFSTQFAAETGIPIQIGVQHHIAHVLSCIAENEIKPPALGISWDGTGYGTDGTIWGGEFFLVGRYTCERIAHFRQFHLPGGDTAVKEPRRAAIGVLYEMFGEAAFEMTLPPFQDFHAVESCAVKAMLQRGLNSPLTSSAGRLFDAVSSLIGLRQITRFEGQAAMELEFAMDGAATDETYDLPTRDSRVATIKAGDNVSMSRSEMILDWQPMVEGILADMQDGVPPGIISSKFHNALAEAIVTVAKSSGLDRVVISGGCFQNRYLTERVVNRLREESFRPYWHQRVPTNDGGIALGQVMAAWRSRAATKKS